VEGFYRRSVSSSYYAVYSAVTSDLVARRVVFAHGWNNPSHEQMPELVLHNTPWPRNMRRTVARKLRLLRQAREDADYRPMIMVDRETALIALQDATHVLELLEISDE
jgi:uncharacterized protein (UPF0332 family)